MKAKVRTRAGEVEGLVEDGLAVFRSIPFAEPPTGELRFRPPVARRPWTGTLDATEFRGYAPQEALGDRPGLFTARGFPDEDCLSLNVWTPGADGERRPVMVWIHGGAFVIGSPSSAVYDGAALARRGDVVVVSLGYRLGALGFAQLDELGGEDYAASGNNGILDQILALEWVRQNISAFGGDPGNVTLFGESAGAISIAVLLAVPRAEGLFHKAICQSGGASIVRRKDRARELARELLEQAGVEDMVGLRALPAEDLVAAQSRLRARGAEQLFGPTADDVVVPTSPMQQIREGASARVPLLIGSNLDEFRYWYLTDPRLPTLGTRHLERRLREVTGGADPEPLVAAYKASRPELDDNQIAVTIVGDIAFRMPTVRMAEARERHGASTWMYLFTRPSPAAGGRLGAAHAMEIPFVFGNLDGHAPLLVGESPGRDELARAMQDAWLAFARNGDPNHAGLPEWPGWSSAEPATMILDEPCRLDPDPLPEERRAWGAAPFTLHV